MKLILQRINQDDTATEGILTLEKESLETFLCFTLERPWQNNQRGISCIPTGEYYCAPHRRPSGEWSFIIWGQGISQAYDPAFERSEILIHSGNTTADSQGCVLPGRSRSPHFVGHSKSAMGDIRSALATYFSMESYIDFEVKNGTN